MSDNGKVQTPAGFTPVTSTDARGWWRPEPGVPIMGRLIGRFTMSNGRAFYQVKIAAEVENVSIIVGRSNDAKVETAEPGDIVNFDERKAIESLRPYAESDGIYDVWLMPGEKITLPNSNTFWPIDVAQKQLRAPSVPISASPKEVADNDLPF